MLVYVLIASLWSDYGTVSLVNRSEYKTYDECAHAAKMFFYENTDKDAYPFDALEGHPFYMRGGLNFTWHCEGYVRP
jgi:hypothetical protein